MPWDCSLNKDLKNTVMRHVSYMCHLPEDDKRKFSVSTPRRGSWAFCRILDHEDSSPRNERILQGIEKVLFQSMEKIRQAKGVLILGISDWKGRRVLQQHVSHINKRGGKMVRQPEKDRVYWIHPDAWPAYELKLQTSTDVHAGTQQSTDSDAQVGEGED
jgi:hypothetical protein